MFNAELEPMTLALFTGDTKKSIREARKMASVSTDCFELHVPSMACLK